MIAALRSIGVWIGTGPLAPVATLLALVTTLAALLIVGLEISGRTLSGRRIVPSGIRWDRTALVVLVVTALFVVIADPVRFEFIRILKRGPRLVPALAPVVSVVFGLPGVLGFMLGTLITRLTGDSLAPMTVVGAVWGALAWLWVTWLPYKMVRRLDFSTVRAALGSIGNFYLWAVVVGPLLHLWSAPVRRVLMGEDPAEVWARMFPMILINHDLPYVVVGPIALLILYPLARLGRLYWRDRQEAIAAA